MKLSYRLIRETHGYTAECVESDAAGEGNTEAEAVASLRRALEERLLRPDAIAPPSRPCTALIELVRAEVLVP